MSSLGRAILVLSLFGTMGVPGHAVAAATDSDGDGLRDAWERHWGVTSPRVRDSDGDGVRDPAEDPDRDGLSNLGEQRFGSSPQEPDTDGDGRSDAQEDSDHDGRSNGAEQDHRRVPGVLAPSLSGAYRDIPGSMRACHNRGSSAEIHPCVFGDAHGQVRITLYGDSHALQWLPALQRVAATRGWRVVSITKSACPSAHVRYDDRTMVGSYASCRLWRSRAEQWIHSHRQDLVIVSNSRGYDLLDAHGRVMSAAAANGAWRLGLGRTLDALPGYARKLVLGDPPVPGRNVPACLAAHPSDISACVRSRAGSSKPAHDHAERAAAGAHGAMYQSTATAVCPYDPCPVIVDGLLLWRDRSHLTATYARQLAPSIRKMVQAALSP